MRGEGTPSRIVMKFCIAVYARDVITMQSLVTIGSLVFGWRGSNLRLLHRLVICMFYYVMCHQSLYDHHRYKNNSYYCCCCCFYYYYLGAALYGGHWGKALVGGGLSPSEIIDVFIGDDQNRMAKLKSLRFIAC